MIQRGLIFAHMVMCTSQERPGYAAVTNYLKISVPQNTKFIYCLFCWSGVGLEGVLSHVVTHFMVAQFQHGASGFTMAGESRMEGNCPGKEMLWPRSDMGHFHSVGIILPNCKE